MKVLRPKIHDLFNKLNIAHGMIEAIKDSIDGTMILDSDLQRHKIEKAMKAIDQAENIAQEMRSLIRHMEGDDEI